MPNSKDSMEQVPRKKTSDLDTKLDQTSHELGDGEKRKVHIEIEKSE
jgi:hypothetical protein